MSNLAKSGRAMLIYSHNSCSLAFINFFPLYLNMKCDLDIFLLHSATCLKTSFVIITGGHCRCKFNQDKRYKINNIQLILLVIQLIVSHCGVLLVCSSKYVHWLALKVQFSFDRRRTGSNAQAMLNDTGMTALICLCIQ